MKRLRYRQERKPKTTVWLNRKLNVQTNLIQETERLLALNDKCALPKVYNPQSFLLQPTPPGRACETTISVYSNAPH